MGAEGGEGVRKGGSERDGQAGEWADRQSRQVDEWMDVLPVCIASSSSLEDVARMVRALEKDGVSITCVGTDAVVHKHPLLFIGFLRRSYVKRRRGTVSVHHLEP